MQHKPMGTTLSINSSAVEPMGAGGGGRQTYTRLYPLSISCQYLAASGTKYPASLRVTSRACSKHLRSTVQRISCHQNCPWLWNCQGRKGTRLGFPSTALNLQICRLSVEPPHGDDFSHSTRPALQVKRQPLSQPTKHCCPCSLGLCGLSCAGETPWYIRYPLPLIVFWESCCGLKCVVGHSGSLWWSM